MFSTIRRFIGSIAITENNKDIVVEGVSSLVLAKDIYNNWSTSIINNFLFTEMSSSSMRFLKFFAPEVLYMLNTLIGEKRKHTSVRTLMALAEKLRSDTWLSRIDATDVPDVLNFHKLNEVAVTLLPHQMEFLRTYNRNVPRYNLKGFLLGAVPGSGKTLTCLATSLCLEADVTVIFSPKNAIYDVWTSTIAKMLKGHRTYWVAADGKPLPKQMPQFLIFHYEMLDKALAIGHELAGKKVVIVLDESHNFNEITSQRTKLFVDFCGLTGSKDIIWSSGTPIKAIGSEAIPILRTIDTYFTPDAEQRFLKIFGKNSSRANDILCHRMGFLSFKVTKSDIMGSLPAPEEHEVKVSSPNGGQFTLEKIREEMKKFIVERLEYYQKHMARYERDYDACIRMHRDTLHTKKQLEDFGRYRNDVAVIRAGYDPSTMKAMAEYCNWYELQQIVPSLHPSWAVCFKDIRSVIKYMNLKVQGECLGRILGRRRIECNVDLVSHTPYEELIEGSEKKTIIFSNHVDVVNEVVKLLKSLGYDPVVVYGDTNKDIDVLIEKARKNPNANPIVATYQSLSTAIPLVEANTVILADQPFREYVRDQAISRANRLGQDTQVQVYNVLLDTGHVANISTRSQDIVAWSRLQVEEILGTKIKDMETSLEGFVEPPSVVETVPRYLTW